MSIRLGREPREPRFKRISQEGLNFSLDSHFMPVCGFKIKVWCVAVMCCDTGRGFFYFFLWNVYRGLDLGDLIAGYGHAPDATWITLRSPASSTVFTGRQFAATQEAIASVIFSFKCLVSVPPLAPISLSDRYTRHWPWGGSGERAVCSHKPFTLALYYGVGSALLCLYRSY